MRGFVERMEFLERFAPDDTVIGYDEVIESFLDDADARKDAAKDG